MVMINLFKYWGIFLFLLLINSSLLLAANYYVDNNATGNNNGTSWQNAWQSFTDIDWGIIGPGDTIFISGGSTSNTYFEFIDLPDGLSGTAGNSITITAGTDAGHDGVVILDGSSIPNNSAVSIDESGYITVSNLDLRYWLCSPSNRGTIGIFNSHNILIENNTIIGWSQGVKIADSYDCSIRNNYYTTIDYNENQTDGIYATRNTNNIYEGNYINISNGGASHNDCFQGQEEGACIIRYNYMIHTGGSALKPVDSQGIFDKYSHGLHQYIGNFIYLPNQSTPQQQMNDGILDQQNPLSGEPASVYMLNNTIVGASTHTVGIEANTAIIKNNLVVMLDDIAFVRYSSSINKTDIDYNLYYKNGTVGNSVVLGYSNFSEWQSAGGDVHGLNVDPQLDSEFKTIEGSPPVDAGTNLIDLGVLMDLLGVTRPQGAAFDIGAYELLSGPDIYPPEVESASLLDSVTLQISFSEPLEISSAEDPGNYSITGGISVLSASLSGTKVTLSTSTHSPGVYTITVSNVTDLAGNIISPTANSAQYEMLEDPQFGLVQFEIINATASVTPEPEHSPDKAIDGLGYDDGDPDSRWAGDTMPEWIMFDMGTIKNVSLVRISFFNWNNGRIYEYSISVSEDSNQWTEVVSNASSVNEEWTSNEFQPVDARYIRINFINSNQSTWAGLWEGQVWGNSATSVGNEEALPDQFILEQNYPNPFNPATNISFTLPIDSRVKLTVYNLLGEKVVDLINSEFTAGLHNISFNAEGLPSGIYFYRMEAGNFLASKKMSLLK